MAVREYKTSEIASLTGGELIGDGDIVINSLSSIELSQKGQITFAGQQKYFDMLSSCDASAVIVPRKIDGLEKTQIVVSNVDQALISVLGAFEPYREKKKGIHGSAVISSSAKIGKDVYIGPFVFIDDDVVIGDDTVIEAGSVVNYESSIGSNCRIDANVSVYHKCSIGNNCVIQSNTTIGSVGFGYRAVNNMPQLIPHYGGVEIADFVEIGANCCVDRAKFGNTTIGLGTKIDNLVQIAHNCKIGRCCMIAGQTGIAGSSEIGDGALIGGQVGIVDHVKIASGVTMTARSLARGNIKDPIAVFGDPARELKEGMKISAEVGRISKTVKKIKELEKKVANLEKANDN
ncbi:MAG: UDP-3-O-(3-hydroxymyristoyl)glucosamine N-acyltransferase [Sedimentisphaeraceae bacterium JB056]